MAKSVYDEQFMTEDQKKQLAAFTAEWERAHAAGDQAAMDAAHAAAERLRAQYGYSGGDEGETYIPLKQGSASSGSGSSGSGSSGSGSSEGGTFKSYVPQTDLVNWAYDGALKAQLGALKSAYEESAEAAQLAREAIPGIYQDKRNDLAAQSELMEHNFNEYAAGTGLASGAKGQARLAMENTRQAGLSDLGAQEAAELSKAQMLQAQLKRAYQDGVAQAVAKGEYERAAALLEEYRRAAQSEASVSRTQADDYYSWRQQWAKEIDEAAERLRKAGQ